eukprot:465642-Rhodomonas_salina.1
MEVGRDLAPCSTKRDNALTRELVLMGRVDERRVVELKMEVGRDLAPCSTKRDNALSRELALMGRVDERR